MTKPDSDVDRIPPIEGERASDEPFIGLPEREYNALQGVVDAARPFVEFARQYPLRPNASLVITSFDFIDVEDLDTNDFITLQAALAALDKLNENAT